VPHIEVENTSFNYRFDGPQEAPVLLFSHSLGASLSMWDPQLPALTKKFRILRYDCRGHGLSCVTPGPYTLERLSRDVLGILDGLKIARAHFCGLSMGGMVGLWLGVNAPTHFDSITLCNTAAKIGTAETWNARIQTTNEGGMAAVADAVIARWFTEGFIKRSPAAVDHIRQTLLHTSPDGYAACCAALRDADLRQSLSRVKLPTLMIAGTYDGVSSPADGHFIVEHIPGAQYAELNAAHLSNIEAHDSFSEALMKFLAQQETQ
jgi:3-oxoadipate enol-lactonase